MKKRTVSMLVVLVMCCGMAFNCYAKKFSDVEWKYVDTSKNHWAEYYIDTLSDDDNNVIKGYPDGTFRPNDSVKTGEYLKMILMSLYPKFVSRDLNEGEHWANPYAERLSKVKVYNLYYLIDYDKYSTTYVLEEDMNRKDMAVLIGKAYANRWNYVSDKTLNISMFSDCAEINEDDANWINIAINAKVINGYPDGTFRPNGKMTRSEAAKVIYKMIYPSNN